MEIRTILPAWIEIKQAEDIAATLNDEYHDRGLEVATEEIPEAMLIELVIQIPVSYDAQDVLLLGEVIGMLYYRYQPVVYELKLNESNADASVLN